jgi:hypothetical protein
MLQVSGRPVLGFEFWPLWTQMGPFQGGSGDILPGQNGSSNVPLPPPQPPQKPRSIAYWSLVRLCDTLHPNTKPNKTQNKSKGWVLAGSSGRRAARKTSGSCASISDMTSTTASSTEASRFAAGSEQPRKNSRVWRHSMKACLYRRPTSRCGGAKPGRSTTHWRRGAATSVTGGSGSTALGVRPSLYP